MKEGIIINLIIFVFIKFPLNLKLELELSTCYKLISEQTLDYYVRVLFFCRFFLTTTRGEISKYLNEM